MKLFPFSLSPIATGRWQRRACPWCGQAPPHDAWNDVEYRDHLTWDCEREA